MKSAQLEAETLAAGLARDLRAASERRSFTVLSLRDQVLGPLASALPFLQGFAALVFLIAAVNIASLVLVRSATHGPETAVRVALGARPSDLVKTCLAEGALLSLAGFGLALLVAWGGRELLWRMAPGSTAIFERIELNSVVLLFGIAMCAAMTAVMGILPMAATRRLPLTFALSRAGHRHVPGGRRRVLRVLVTGQIALATVLLLGAGVLRASLHRLLNVDAGYQTQHVVTADILLFVPRSQPIIRQLVQRLRSVPGVEAVGLIHSTPLTGKWTVDERIGLVRDGPPELTPPVAGNMVAFDYFAAMGIPIVAGRDFTEQDLVPDPPSIIINELAARRFFPEGNPVGARVVMFGAPREIVGVVRGTRDVRLDTPPEPQWYQPMFFDGSQVVVRTSGKPGTFVETLRRELLAADPRLIVTRVAPLDEIVGESILERRMTTHLVTAFAGLALTLALVGLYGVMQFTVSTRRREFGVRSALGATPTDLVRIVLRQGLSAAAAGIVLALMFSFPLARAIQQLLFEVQPTNALVMAGMPLLVVFVSLVACARPAWHAASVDPVVALRTE